MTRSLSSANQSALEQRRLVARDFLWVIARDRDTGNPQTVGFWSGASDVAADVINPDTGNAVSRNFYGSGTLISIDDIPLVSNTAVQNVTIRMSQIDDLVQQAFRLYDIRQARVEIYRGLFNPATRQMVAPAFCRFVGFVDLAEVTTPAENEEGGLTLTCASHTQELQRWNTDTRSNQSQDDREDGDRFYRHTVTTGEWEVYWGRKNGKVRGRRRKKRR